MKKIISFILKVILSKNIYDRRRDTIFFIFYGRLEFFLLTFKFRLQNIKLIFLPSRHIGAIILLDRLSKIFKKNNFSFFLWSASLLGVVRKQNAIAGSVRDIDIAMIFNKKKHLKFLLSLKKEFKLRFHNGYNAVQLFHQYGTIDISLFKKKKTHFEIILDVPLSKETITHNKKNYKKKKFIYKLSEFSPFKKGKLYSKNFLLPNNPISILNKEYGKNWKIPDKKRQVYY